MVLSFLTDLFSLQSISDAEERVQLMQTNHAELAVVLQYLSEVLAEQQRFGRREE